MSRRGKPRMMRDGAGCAPKHQDSIGKDPPRQRELKVRWLDDRFGSKATFRLSADDFRSTPINRHSRCSSHVQRCLATFVRGSKCSCAVQNERGRKGSIKELAKLFKDFP